MIFVAGGTLGGALSLPAAAAAKTERRLPTILEDWKKGNDVATDKATSERILACLSAVVDARIKPMFGEYSVYADEKMIGQINENRLFIKVTKFGEEYAPELEKASPYPGAKPAFIVPEQRLTDPEWLREFAAGTRRALK